MLNLHIVNISHLAEVSDYRWSVDINGHIIAAGVLEGHRRSDGWAELVRRIGEQGDTMGACGQPSSRP